MHANDVVNHGIILRPGPAPDDVPRTFIISGIGRSGTTMIATILREAGIFLGEHLTHLVNEDSDMLDILHARDIGRLDRLIAARNAMGVDWGFKIPHIGAFLQPGHITHFRNPHLILIFRDPVAITVRHAAADYIDPVAELNEIAIAIGGLTHFFTQTTCPALLISYEKALLFPEAFLDALSEFCTLPTDTMFRQHMIGLIEPNSPAYIRVARRQFAGRIESYRDGRLQGWCCQVGFQYAVELELFLNGNKAARFLADRSRPDLAQAGHGDGRHGFSLGFDAPPDTVVRIQVAGRTIELDNSGRRLAEYG